MGAERLELSRSRLSGLGNEYKHGDGISKIDEIKTTWTELIGQSGNSRRGFASAGGVDVLSLSAPTLQVLKIMDGGSFFPLPQFVQDQFTPFISSHLTENSNQYMPLIEILSLMPEDMGTEFLQKMQEEAENEKTTILSGYLRRTSKPEEFSNSNNFLKIIDELLVMGVDLSTLEVGRFDNEYRMKFIYQGQEKHLLYEQAWINPSYEQEGSQQYESLRTTFGEFEEGDITLIIRADFNNVASYVISGLNPKSIITDYRSYLTILNSNKRYIFFPVENPTYPSQPWGYGPVTDVKIGKQEGAA